MEAGSLQAEGKALLLQRRQFAVCKSEKRKAINQHFFCKAGDEHLPILLVLDIFEISISYCGRNHLVLSTRPT